jgi:hypothetical protein
MDLKNLNLVEMNSQEMRKTEGGFLGYVIAALAYFLVESGTNPKSSVKHLESGWNSQGWK